MVSLPEKEWTATLADLIASPKSCVWGVLVNSVRHMLSLSYQNPSRAIIKKNI